VVIIKVRVCSLVVIHSKRQWRGSALRGEIFIPMNLITLRQVFTKFAEEPTV